MEGRDLVCIVKDIIQLPSGCIGGKSERSTIGISTLHPRFIEKHVYGPIGGIIGFWFIDKFIFCGAEAETALKSPATMTGYWSL